MPKLSPRRILCRTVVKRVDTIWWVQAYDQGNVRYPEADYKASSHEEARQISRERINNSFSTED